MLVPFQRDPILNDDALIPHIEFAENQLAMLRMPEGKARMLAQIGTYYRQTSDPARAIPYFKQAVEICRAANLRKLEAVNTLRLGVALQYAGQVQDAEDVLQIALTLCERYREHEDYAYQHWGKFLVERGAVAEAIPYFEAALRKRIAGGNPDLIESSRAALEGARVLLKPDGAE
ncbi:MAG: tetratricopeptide repeat protein [Chloroflexi bacterium]|nr:tetratricopeptide repeat protein [Chloroflexota bacterium]MBV6437631.1 hypothetical protein [Anaerolineae bacterium]NOG52104.1 tetratricopeptide repeat protein [Chloroflexota bacterium]GIK30050.1 MAG: hypothetical protein BroJett007_31880 [Chloroflexota bacterium]